MAIYRKSGDGGHLMSQVITQVKASSQPDEELALLAAYERGRSDERARCVAKVKHWFGGDDIFDLGYECVREIENG